MLVWSSEMTRKKTGSTPKLPPWEPCDRLMEQQRPAAPLTGALPNAGSIMKMSQVSRDGGERRRIVFGSVRFARYGNPPRVAHCSAAGHRPAACIPPYCKGAHSLRSITRRNPIRTVFLQPERPRARQGSREQPWEPLPTAVAGIPGIRCPLFSAEAGAAGGHGFPENPGNRVRALPSAFRKKQVEGRELRPTNRQHNPRCDKEIRHEPGKPNPEDLTKTVAAFLLVVPHGGHRPRHRPAAAGTRAAAGLARRAPRHRHGSPRHVRRQHACQGAGHRQRPDRRPGGAARTVLLT